jgi:hypothetical protein
VNRAKKGLEIVLAQLDMKHSGVFHHILLLFLSLWVVIILNHRPFSAPFYCDSTLFVDEQSRRYVVGGLRSVAALKPDHPAAYTDLGVMLANAGLIQGTAPHFREALKANPNGELAKANLETGFQQMQEISGDQN